jgi:hypothetical protein
MIIGVNGKIGSGKDTIGKIIQCLMNHPKITNKDLIWMMENNVVAEDSKCEIKKFAGKLKQIGSILSGVPVEMFEDQEFKKLDVSPEWWKKDINWGIEKLHGEHVMKDIPMTYREFLQKLGTEAMRDGLHVNVWVNALFADYTPTHYLIGALDTKLTDGDPVYPNWIITDMRFPNEMDAVVERKGITIRVVRDTTCPECGVTGGHKMYVHKDKSLTDLHPSETALDDAYFDYVISNNGSLEDLVEKVKEILIKENII